MASIKTLQTLLAEIKTFLRAFNRSLDTSDNSIAKDLLLLPFSIGGKIIMGEISKVQNLHILDRLAGTDLDNEATNYKKERLTGSYATVTLTFYATTLPSSDIVIPAGTSVRTSGTSFVSPVTFTTVAEARFAVGSMPAYYSYDRSRYEFTAAAACDISGTVGNVGATFINTIVSAVSDIAGATNRTAAIGGRDEELDDDLRDRIRLAKTGRELNVVNGLRKYLKDLGFIDAYAISAEDSDAERTTGVDAFVIDTSLAAKTDTFTYDPSQPRYYFSKRPIIAASAPVAVSVGTLPASQYSVTKDSTSGRSRSTEAIDYVEISTAAALSAGETFTISYTYPETLYNSQGNFDLPENNILTADVLLKQAYPMYLYINASLTLLPNADGATVRNRVRNALSQYINENYRLGNDIQKSDLIIVLQEGYGDYPVTSVDAVIIHSYYLRDESGNSTMPTNEIIPVNNKQYVVLGQATIV